MTVAVPQSLQSELERPYPLSDDQIESFRRDGFVHLSDVFSPALLQHFAEQITGAVDAENPHDVPLEQRDAYSRAFTQVTNLWPRHPGIQPFCFNRRCARIATELLGCRGVRMWHDQALFKEAGGDATPWHVDQFFWPLSSPLSVSAWIPLQPTSVENGALQFAAGAQHADHGRNLGISVRGGEKIAESLANAGTRIVAEPFALGDVSFHSGFTYHRSEPNRGDTTRAVMTMIYIDAAMRVAEPANPFQEYDRKKWAPGCEVGDPIASELNPVLFSRDN